MNTEFSASDDLFVTCTLCHEIFPVINEQTNGDHESICWHCSFLLHEDDFHSQRRRRNRRSSSESADHLFSQQFEQQRIHFTMQSDSSSPQQSGDDFSNLDFVYGESVSSLSIALSFSVYAEDSDMTDSELSVHGYEESDIDIDVDSDNDPMHAATDQWNENEEDAIESIGSTDGVLDPIIGSVIETSRHPINSFVKSMEWVMITKEEEDGGSSCAICKEVFRVGREVKRLPCLHMYHEWCILPWLSAHNSCPLCRYELPCDGDTEIDEIVRSGIDDGIGSIDSDSMVDLNTDDQGFKEGKWFPSPGSIVSMVVGIVIVVWFGHGRAISVFKLGDSKKAPWPFS